MNCIYCGRKEFDLDKKGEPMKFSQEHILPSSLVGMLEDNKHFTISNVHEYCNNVAGLFIDAPAVRNWFVSQAIADNATNFVKIEDNPILPLRYMGIVEELKYGEKICELWIGPAGSTIYHFHDPFPLEGLPAMVGIPPSIKRKNIDFGFTFIFVTNDNEIWYPTIFYSFINAFKESDKYLGNGNTPPGGAFSDIPKKLKDLHTSLKNISGKTHKAGLNLALDGEVRFLAKIALGIGYKLLGDDFANSESAKLLRGFMWAKDSKEREVYPVHGTGFSNINKDENSMKELFGWEGGHVLSLTSVGGAIGLHITIYNTVTATIKIDDFKEEYKNIIGDGLCYIIVPGLRKVVGPMKQIHFLQHKLNMGRKNDELLEIELEMEKYKIKPPFDINKTIIPKT